MISARNNAAGHRDSGWWLKNHFQPTNWGGGGCFHIDHIVKHHESLLKLRFGLLLFFLYWTRSVELDKLDIIGPHYSNPISSTTWNTLWKSKQTLKKNWIKLVVFHSKSDQQRVTIKHQASWGPGPSHLGQRFCGSSHVPMQLLPCGLGPRNPTEMNMRQKLGI